LFNYKDYTEMHGQQTLYLCFLYFCKEMCLMVLMNWNI